MIAENLKELKATIPEHVTLIAVSKTKPVSDIVQAYDAGHRIFGENKIQEMVSKFEVLPKDIEWHMIGHLQRNKVKYMAHFVSLIHGVDSLKTLKEINKQAAKHQRTIACLLQVKIAQEATKFGLDFSEVEKIMASDELKELDHIKIVGLMAMASFTSDQEQIVAEFSSLDAFYRKLQSKYNELTTLSIGMSGDYQIAIENGSTMIRVGSAIFGERTYL